MKAALALAMLALLDAPAHAFVRQATSDGTPIGWDGSCPLLELGTLDPRGPDADVLQAAFRTAIAAWQEAGCLDLPFALSQPAEPIHEATYDGHNVVLTRGPDYCDDDGHADEEICLNSDTLALTTLYYIDKPGDPRNGETLEVDMEINLAHPFATDGRSDAYDLGAAITHEIGHVLGLGHTCTTTAGAHLVDPAGYPIPSCELNIDEIRSSVMYPWAELGEVKRDLRSDEKQAMCLLYRNRPAVCENGELSAGCAASSDSGSGVPLVIGGAVIVWLLAPRRRWHVA